MGLLSRLGGKDGGRANGFPIDIVIALKSPAAIEPKKFIEGFAGRWGTKVGFTEDSELSEPGKKMRAYVLTNGKSKIIITNRSEPLSKSVCKTLSDLIGDDEEEKKELLRNNGSLLLQIADMGEHAAERATFAAQILLYFMEGTNSLGYSCKSGYFYRPRKWASFYFNRRTLEPADLFTLLDSIHFMSDARWVHTHGLEQFGLPDIEIRYRDRWREEYYGDLIANAAVYCIEKGPVLHVGNAAEMMGDGVIFKVIRPRLEPGHHYGKFGTIGLTKI